VGRFFVGSIAAVAVVLVGGFFAVRSVTVDEAERDTREQVAVLARLVESAGLTDGVVRGDQRSLAKLDDVVQGQVLSKSVVRVKVWTEDGKILYSDEPALIGRRFELGEDERELFHTGGAEAELSDLARPENRFERQAGKLLEAHTTIRTPDGTQVLFEVYQRFGSVTQNAERILTALAPPLIGGMVVLLLFQLPLAYSLARSLQRGHREREELLANAVEASTQERRRIAADLHDGVVQDLAGVAFGLAPLAEGARREGDTPRADAIGDSIERLRQGIRSLRSLLVEIHPPNLESTGLEAALNDLLSPLEAGGVSTHLSVEDGAGAGSDQDALIYRVVRESLRNVQSHASADNVWVRVQPQDPATTLVCIEDDGTGFSPAQRELRAEEGHLGLSLLEGVVRQAGGRLDIRSVPGRGTTVELEVPA
jgi:two-component system NarL family sensor kinase